MQWVDSIIGEIEKRFAAEIKAKQPLILRDEKTLSGRVHIGSLRGIVIHGIIAQVLQEKGIVCDFLFELNDFDPMDELPATLERRDEWKQYMGQPLFTVPSPDPNVAENYPLVFGNELKDVVHALKLPITYYPLAPLYKEGKFNEVIHDALEHAAEIRAIYREVSGSQKPDDWYPLQVICEKCGKVGTTQVTGWNGKEVTYMCKKDLVKWAQGCGHSGTVSPFDGHAKLPWKVEWPAKWKVMNVKIEGAGKDHSAAGGSRDIGRRIVEEIFQYPEPLNIPYEFFNIGGKKMSASKGLGASAKEVSDLLPPKILKLLMIRKQPNQPIDFEPEGVTIPQLFDEYDRLADYTFGRSEKPEPDFARTFALTQTDFPKQPKDLWHMRFSLVAFIVQMPHLDLLKEAAQAKGSSLSEAEKSDLQERADYARRWLTACAPDQFRFTFVEAADFDPENLPAISAAQKKAFGTIHQRLQETMWKGEEVHKVLHAVKTELNMPPKEIFAPLYQLFFKRDDGPQMGWLLSTLSKEEVLKRIHTYTA
ncbi:MAG: lysine--tRNA ligase [Candidatus Peribacteraceae bacterium]|nr:lysine--tRNA ligase [Candidatus Peribacteraceae bacterium]MDD5742066.1 lysine--tRNA ligase [Candidatus Peribacteraceae bacterium]